MPDIGYYTLPVIPSFRGITGQIRDGLNKSFKDVGTSAGKIMGQSAGAAFAKDPSLDKAMGTAPASMTVLTAATDKQTAAVGRLQDAHKQLSTSMQTPDQQTRVIAVQDKQTESLRKAETQVKQAKTAHDELARSIKKVNDEQVRTSDLSVSSVKQDIGKAISGDAQGAIADLGKQLGAKIGGTLRDTVKDVTGMSVDTMTDKVKGAADALGVDIGGALDKALKGDRSGALQDVGKQLGSKIGAMATDQVKGLTGIDLGGTGLGDFLAANAPGAAGAALDWARGGGIGSTLDFLKSGGISQALGALRQPGGIRGALGNLDPKSLLGGINDLTGGGAQPILDMHGGITDLAEGLLGGTAAERFLPAIADAALPVAAGTFLGQKVGRGLQELDRGRVEAGYDETGTAVNPIERAVESIPLVGDFLGPSKDIREANMRRRDAQVGSSESFYKSIFGDDRSGIGLGGGGAGGSTTAQEVQVESSVATIQAGQVILGGNLSLPASMTGAGSTGGGRAPSSLGSAGTSLGTGENSLYGGDTGGAYFAHGGGPKGTDTVPAWLTPGEIVLDKDTSDRVRSLFGSRASYFDQGGTAGPDVLAAHSMAGTPYSQGHRDDCSGMVGRVILRAMGRPESGLPTTQNMGQWLAALGFKSGVGGPGAITVGWYNHGSSPNDGHAAITLSDGSTAEAGGSHNNFMVGGGAAGASNPEFDQHMFLPNLFGQGPGSGMPASAPGGGSSGGGGAGGLGGLLGGGGGAGGDLMGTLSQVGGIGHQFLQDTLGLGSLFPDPTSDPLVQSGMAMMQAVLGMATQPGGLKAALTSDAAGKRTFGAMFGDSGGDAGGGGFGMIPQVAGMPHPDDMPSSPGDAAFGDVLSTRIGGGEATHIDNSQHLTVTGHSADEVGKQIYRNWGQNGGPNNTPRMNTHLPVGG